MTLAHKIDISVLLLQKPVYQERKNPQQSTFLNLKNPLLWPYESIIQKLKHVIIRSLILLPESDQEGRYEIILIFLIALVPEYLGIVDVGYCLLLVHYVEYLAG